MDSRDRLRAQLAGAGCIACGAGIPADGIAVLADRGDLAFVELRCSACGSETLGVVLPDGGDPAGTPVLLDAPVGERSATPPPISLDDVIAVRRALDEWQGDLRSLVERPERRDTGAA